MLSLPHKQLLPVVTAGVPVYTTRTNTKTVYRITTFYKLDVPVIDLAIQFPISSDTRAIFDFANNTGGGTP